MTSIMKGLVYNGVSYEFGIPEPVIPVIDFLLVGGGGHPTFTNGSTGGSGGGVIHCCCYEIQNGEYAVVIGIGGDTACNTYCGCPSCFGDFVASGGNGGQAGCNGGDGACGTGGIFDGTKAGDGGLGYMSDISGENYYYAGGGGGGGSSYKTCFCGGNGCYGGGHGGLSLCNPTNSSGTNATTYGSGGGGYSVEARTPPIPIPMGGSSCGTGCQGIFIARYPSNCGYNITGGTKYECNGYCIHCFTQDGTLIVN